MKCSIAVATVITSLGPGGCGWSSQEEALKSEIETTLSWTATVRWGETAWRRREVPSPYFADLLSQASKQLKQCEENIGQWPTGQNGKAAVGVLGEMDESITAAGDAVARGDTEKTEQMLRKLPAQEAVLRGMVKSQGGGS